MEDTDWRPSACPNCGRLRHAARRPVCTNPACSMSRITKDEGVTKMITAKEARELAGPTFDEIVEEQLEFAYEQIRLAAENRKREVILHSEFWTRGGYNQAPEYQAAINKLKELGFEGEFFYEERQFVNMYTIVRW